MLMGVTAVVNPCTENAGGPDGPVSIHWGDAKDVGGFWVNNTGRDGDYTIKFTPFCAEHDVMIAVDSGRILVWAEFRDGNGNGERRQLEVYLNP